MMSYLGAISDFEKQKVIGKVFYSFQVMALYLVFFQFNYKHKMMTHKNEGGREFKQKQLIQTFRTFGLNTNS
jgi:hypothetical protein